MRVVLLVLASVLVRTVSAQDTRVELAATLSPEAGLELEDDFGSAVDISGWIAVVGASGDSGRGGLVRSGAVYVFEWNGQAWSKTHRIEGTVPQANRRFGSAVAIEYDRIVVGAPGTTDGAGNRTGAVHVFQFDGTMWNETARVQARLQDNGDLGSAVAISGNTVFAGAPSRNVTGGSALVLERGSSGWAIADTLVGETGTFGVFGASVDLEGSRAVIHDGGSAVLRFYARGPDAWTEVSRDSVLERTTHDLSLSGTRLAVAQSQSLAGEDARLLLYEHHADGWARADSLTPESEGEGYRDVQQVGLDGDLLIASARWGGSNGRTLTAYFRGPGGWTPQPLALEPSFRYFNIDIALDGTWFLLGDPDGGDTTGSRDTGAAEISRVTPEAPRSNVQRLVVPGTRRRGSQFGRTVEFSGSGIIAGGQGSVYVMEETEGASGVAWRDIQVLSPSREVRPYRATADGEWMLVSDPLDDYVQTYRHESEGWVNGPALSGTGSFGYSMSIDGERAIIGAPLDGTGAAFVYERRDSFWVRVAELRGSSGSVRFGHAVALDGGRALVASRESRSDGGRGTVSLYERHPNAEWVFSHSLIPSATGIFGNRLAMDGSRILVGSQITQGAPDIVETVSVHGGTAPILQATLDGPVPRAQFGASLAIDGDRVLIGAPSSDVQGLNFGAAYLFEFDGLAWSDGIEILSPEASGGQFGASVDVDGRRLLIGAPLDDSADTDAGIAYVFAATNAVPSDHTRPLAEAALSAPWPNPSRDRSVLTFETPTPTALTVTLHDALGRSIQTLTDRDVYSETDIAVEIGGLAPGVYLVRAAWSGGTQTRALTVVR